MEKIAMESYRSYFLFDNIIAGFSSELLIADSTNLNE